MKNSILKNKSIILAVSCLLAVNACKDILTVEDISEKQVSLIAPSNATILAIENINFSWDAVDYAEEYRLQIASPDFKVPSQIVLDSMVTSTNFGKTLDPGTYQWRVRAENSAFFTDYTLPWNLTVDEIAFVDKIIVLTSPANNLNTYTTLQTLAWESVLGATSYTLQVLDESGITLLDETITETSMEITFTEGTFIWQVKATNGTDETAFTTNNILVDLTAPNTPTLVAPANNGTTTETTINFGWDRTDIAGSVEKDSIYVYSDNTLQTLVTKDMGSDKTFSTTLSANTFYWTVMAFDEAGNASNISDTFSFTIN